MNSNLRFIVLGALGSALGLSLHAQGTAFTYQGRLNVGGSPANGSYDVQFTLFASNAGGVAIAGPVVSNAAAVTNGLFTTLVDFGSGAFLGNPNWLDIAVRTNGASTFTELTPRQPITPAPYAIFAEGASAAGLTGTVGNGQLANNGITVGAGQGLSGGGTVALGGTTTLANAGVLAVAGNADITATTTGGTVTLGDTAVSADTAGTIVKRDGSGSFSANTLTLDGNLALPANNSTVYSGGSLLVHSGSFPGGFLPAIDFFAGLSAGNLTMSGHDNTAIGGFTLNLNTSGTANLALGAYALFGNSSGSYNTASGCSALLDNTNGSFNTANGYQALQANSSGSKNTADGANALAANTTGDFNLADGYTALYGNQTGSANVAHGYQALYNNVAGNNNVADGVNALYASATGSDNTGDGYGALQNLTSGSGNIALGYTAGFGLNSGNNNIYIGNNGIPAESGIIRIGNSATHTATYLAGTAYVQVLAITSDRNAKENFAAVNSRAVLAKVAALPVTEWNYKTDRRGEQHIGPMAQDFQAAFGLNGADDKHISIADEGGVALAAIQGLDQKLEETRAENARLNEANAALAKRLNELEQAVQSLVEKK